MNLGFNSDVRLGDTVYHVQTEDRGAAHPFIDTTVYVGGRVLYRRSTSYRDLLSSAGASEALLQQRLETQHRGVVEELRGETLKFEAPAAPGAVPGIEVQLLNPASWLASGTATLEIQVRARGTRQPAAGANVEVAIEGAQGPARFVARTNAQGCAEVSFPLLPLGPGGAAVFIRATGPAGEDEIRYQLRPRPAVPSPQT